MHAIRASARTMVAAAVVVGWTLTAAQQQSNPRTDWPCGGRLDPSYFQVAEGSGGHMLLLAPDEIGDSASLLTAFDSHRQTIFRLAGSLKFGVHQLAVPIDPSVESAAFSISVQCLGLAEVLKPSGLPASGEGVTDLSNFRAQRMVIVAKPDPGVWTIRVSGSGVAGIVVQARSAIGVTQVQFAPAGSSAFNAVPAAGVENVMRIRISGKPSEVRAALVSGEFRKIVDLPLEAGDAEGAYVSRFTPGAQAFRILVSGKDGEGAAFQRMHAPLLTPAR